MDENVVEEIKMHQETIAAEVNSPLQMIREKELEISGRMLAAKRSADSVVADARKRAAEIVARAEAEGGSGAQDRAQVIETRAQEQAVQLRESAKSEAASIRDGVSARRQDAVDLVLKVVTTV